MKNDLEKIINLTILSNNIDVALKEIKINKNDIICIKMNENITLAEIEELYRILKEDKKINNFIIMLPEYYSLEKMSIAELNFFKEKIEKILNGV